jgi:1-deoxy-D-xylulose-5-phosphate reductoisomerase
MGDKITIDSATMMNKGLELIEAHHLFEIPHERIDIVVHPESILHSMVEFLDGSVLAQLSTTDMYLPILNALTWPERIPNPVPPLDFAAIRSLTFEPPDPQRFPCLDLAHRSIAEGGTMPTVLNAANEVAVARFLAGEIGLLDIPDLIGRAMGAHSRISEPTLDEIFAADEWARREVESLCSSRT